NNNMEVKTQQKSKRYTKLPRMATVFYETVTLQKKKKNDIYMWRQKANGISTSIPNRFSNYIDGVEIRLNPNIYARYPMFHLLQ
ncbi:hypothetical protein BB560_005873, partial [Smittium megazygosporum]